MYLASDGSRELIIKNTLDTTAYSVHFNLNTVKQCQQCLASELKCKFTSIAKVNVARLNIDVRNTSKIISWLISQPRHESINGYLSKSPLSQNFWVILLKKALNL